MKQSALPAFSEWSYENAKRIAEKQATPDEITLQLAAHPLFLDSYCMDYVPDEDPGIIYTTVSLRCLQPNRISKEIMQRCEQFRNALYDYELQNKKILSIEDMNSALNQITEISNDTDAPDSCTAKVLHEIIYNSGFLVNMELYRLTSDPDTQVFRCGEPGELEVVLKENAPWTQTLPDYIVDYAKYKLVRYWFVGQEKKQYRGKDFLLVSTIGELKETNDLALDRAERNALAAIQHS